MASKAVAAKTRNARFEARLSPDVLAAVKRAAEIEGRSVSDFVVDAAHRAANRTIEQTQMIRLSLADQELFAKVMLEPPAPSAALDKAMKRHRELFRHSE